MTPPTPTVEYHCHTSRRTLRNNDMTLRNGNSADDDGVVVSATDTNSIDLNARAVLGETLDICLQNGKYNWSNHHADQMHNYDVRSSLNEFSEQISTASTSNVRSSYKRIQFPGCGAILLHQQPEYFLDPNTSKIEYECNSGVQHQQRRDGRTGVTLWSASHVISNYIDKQWSKDGVWYHDDNSRWVVLELGAGLGLCSAVAAKHGMDVISTDSDPMVLSLLNENLQRNKASSKQQLQVHSLDWKTVASDHPLFLQLEFLSGVNLILLSDVIYGATQPSWDALLVLLNKFRCQSRRLRVSSVDPIVLLGYTQRRRDMTPKDEARFFAAMKAAGIEAVLIPFRCIPHGEKYMLTSLFKLRWVE